MLFGDVHYAEESTVDEERWFPATVRKLPKKEKEGYLKHWDRLTQTAFWKLLKEANLLEPFDFLIDLGDSTSGTGQRGLVTAKVQREREKYNKLIADAFPKTPKFFLWGDHDVGYNDAITEAQGWKGERMSIGSFRVAEKLIGPSWYNREIEGFTLLFLNSEIIRESKNSDNPDQEFFVQKAKEQERFIQECLKNTSDKIILLIHDPMQIRYLQRILAPYKENIIVLAGHLHSPAIWKIYYIFSRIVKAMKLFGIRIPNVLQKTQKQRAIKSLIQEMTEMQQTIQLFDIKIIPAPWGQIAFPKIVFGRGEFTVLELSNGQFVLERHKL